VGACVITLVLATLGDLVYRPADTNGSEARHADQTPVLTRNTEPAPPVVVAQQGTPVRLKNPFDASEVFEFPPGTSRQQARQLVQAVLLQRAQERQPLWKAVKHRNKQRSAGDRYS
jgi:hypothetical protein